MKKIFLFLVVASTALSCFGWGQKGHDVVAFIAEKHLQPEVLAHVEAALGNKSLVYYSNWLDNASHTDGYAYTKTWHYKNVDADVTYETAPKKQKGDVVEAVKSIVEQLEKGGIAPEKENIMLRMLIHLVGDLHQPMHLGHLSDLGGNLHKIKFFKRDNNLHSVWDGSLVDSAHKWSYSEWQSQIDRVSEVERTRLIAGDIDDWAKETCSIAAKIYEATPIGTNISYDYVAEWTPVIEQQFLKGGLRLAHLLNIIYSK